MAEGANIREGYWRAEQESEGIFRDSETYQAKEKLFYMRDWRERATSETGETTVHLSWLVGITPQIQLEWYAQDALQA